MILAFSVQRPTLCIFEDAHWLDPSTLELLEPIISRIDHARVLLIVSCRPEFRPTWMTHANTTMHSLTRLSHTEVKAMIRDILRGGSMPQPLLDQIIEKADGVPLFIEELTNSMLSAPLRTRGTFERAAQPALLRVPDTLSDALMERLDRVAPSRRLAQIAAVIGREFSYDLLSAASQIDEDDMLSALSLLEQADIIYRVGISPFLRFAFKHALLRDAIYDSLLRSKRQQIHADIAAILEHDFPELAENQPQVLAYHYQEAGNHQLAIRCWFESGQGALAHSANVEAIASFRKALQLLNALPETPERIKQEIDIQLALGIPLIAVQGYASAETREAFSRARTLCLQLGNIPEYFQALFGLWGHSWMGGKNDDALRLADEFLSRSRALSEPVPLMVAHRVMGSTLLTIGDFQSSANHFEESIKLSIRQRKTAPIQSLHGGTPSGFTSAPILGLVVSGLSGSIPFARFGSACLGSRPWPPIHRGVRSLHDFCCAPPARGCRSRLRKRRKKLRNVTRTAVFAVRNFVENFARPSSRRPRPTWRGPGGNSTRNRRSAT
jgi:hypothetical protein